MRELGGEILPDMGSEETEESRRTFGRLTFCKDDQGFVLRAAPAARMTARGKFRRPDARLDSM